MSENPYQPPETDSRIVGINDGSIESLRKVARYQKGILICILIQLLAIAPRLVAPPEIQILLAIGLVIVLIVGTVFVFLLAVNVYSTALGIVMGIVALIPCVGLLALLAVNGKATTVLRSNGIKVGLLGADLSKI